MNATEKFKALNIDQEKFPSITGGKFLKNQQTFYQRDSNFFKRITTDQKYTNVVWIKVVSKIAA